VCLNDLHVNVIPHKNMLTEYMYTTEGSTYAIMNHGTFCML
jgi:hypothetical protein